MGAECWVQCVYTYPMKTGFHSMLLPYTNCSKDVSKVLLPLVRSVNLLSNIQNE